MILHERIDHAYQTLLHHAQTRPVILLHPNSKYRSALIAKLIQDHPTTVFYYALGPDDINLQNFIESLAHDMANQHPTFGRHIHMLPHYVFEHMENHLELLLSVFVQELDELHTAPYFFVLDEYDRSDEADDIHRFIEELADYLPPQCRLIINGRTLPRLPWVAMVAKRQAAILWDGLLIERDFYQLSSGGDYHYEAYGLGHGYVLRKSQPVLAWEGHLPRLLFFFGLDRPIVTRADICKAFWPDLNEEQAVNVFHVTKRRLHKALEQDALVHHDSYYRINPQFNVYYDILDFVEALMVGRNPMTSNDNRFEAYQQALQVYRGPFLHGHDEKWVLRRRAAFRIGYAEAILATAHTWTQREKYDVALKLYQQGLDEVYRDQALHRGMMDLYARLGRSSEAVSHFAAFEDYCQQHNILVEDETRQLVQQIQG